MSSRAPKQWSLTKSETVHSFESWKQNLNYILSLGNNFASFLVPNVTLMKKSRTITNRGFIDDTEEIPEASCKSAIQKITHLEKHKRRQTQISAYNIKILGNTTDLIIENFLKAFLKPHIFKNVIMA